MRVSASRFFFNSCCSEVYCFGFLKMGDTCVQKFFPTPEELSSVCSNVKCPQDGCKAVFQSTSNLNMHLIKHHKVENNGLTTKNSETQFFCPAAGCPYHKDSKKYFMKLKYLKQHYLKIHAPKEFSCKKCGKEFSIETFLTLHEKNCGKIFTCTCGSTYTTPEAILTHCKRKGKGHSVVEADDKESKINSSPAIQEQNMKKAERVIYPKLSSDMSFPVHYIAAVALSELSTPCNLSKVVDKGVQTEFSDSSSKDNNHVSVKCDKKRKSSQQTQTTTKYKKMKISTQTQTSIDYLRHKNKAHPRTLSRKRKKSMETQTRELIKGDISESKNNIKNSAQADTSTSNSKSIQNDENKTRKWLWDNHFYIQKDVIHYTEVKPTEIKSDLFDVGNELNLCSKEIDLNDYNQISTKTHQCEQDQSGDNPIFDINKLCNIETQTEIDAFLTECNEDTNFTLCSTTETQTTDDFDSLLYSNMCTQTCEEVDQFFNFNFVHIETQTAWPDLNEMS